MTLPNNLEDVKIAISNAEKEINGTLDPKAIAQISLELGLLYDRRDELQCNKLPIGTKVRVKNQSITGEVVRYDGSKLVIKDDDRTGWNEGEEGTLVYRERELELNKDELQSKKQELYVYECTFYTEDENGGITYYNAPNADWSHIAENVEIEDLEEVSPPSVYAPTFSVDGGEPMI